MIASGKAVLDSLRGINTDWFNELIRVAMYQNHNLSVRGGSEKSSYFVSANIATQEDRSRATAHCAAPCAWAST